MLERERENYEWTEEACLILPQPWPCWSTQTRKLGTADEVNSEWPLNDAAGCQVLTTRLVNKHTYRLPPHSHTAFSTSVNLDTISGLIRQVALGRNIEILMRRVCSQINSLNMKWIQTVSVNKACCKNCAFLIYQFCVHAHLAHLRTFMATRGIAER